MTFPKIISFLLLGFISRMTWADQANLVPLPSPYYSSRPTTVTSPKNQTEAQQALTPVYPSDGVRVPLSNEEQKFYEKNAPVTGSGNHYVQLLNKAWPIAQTHSFWALLLIGGFWTMLLTLLIRKIAQSKPRKPE